MRKSKKEEQKSCHHTLHIKSHIAILKLRKKKKEYDLDQKYIILHISPIIIYAWSKFSFSCYTPILASQKVLRLAKTHGTLASKSIIKFKTCLKHHCLKTCFSRWSHFWTVTGTGTIIYLRKTAFFGRGTNLGSFETSSLQLLGKIMFLLTLFKYS